MNAAQLANAVQTAQAAVAPLLNPVAYAVRTGINDVVIEYDHVDGVGQPDNFRVDGNALWEQEALDAFSALQTAAQTFHDYFINYSFPATLGTAGSAQTAQIQV